MRSDRVVMPRSVPSADALRGLSIVWLARPGKINRRRHHGPSAAADRLAAAGPARGGAAPVRRIAMPVVPRRVPAGVVAVTAAGAHPAVGTLARRRRGG